MKAIWSLNIDDVMEVYKRAKANGKKPGESIEDELLEYMKEKNQKPIGHTEMTKEELLKDAMTKNNSILEIEINDKGKSTYKSYKKKEK